MTELFRRGILENTIQPQNNLEYNQLLIQKLNALYSDEWLAVYQYSTESDFCLKLLHTNKISSPVYNQITKELDIHTTEEFQHAKLLVPELIKLGSGPISHIDQLSQNANFPMLVPQSSEIITLQQSIQSEQGAIDAYTNVLEFVRNHHPQNNILMDKLKFILGQEYEHKDDLEKILSDITQG